MRGNQWDADLHRVLCDDVGVTITRDVDATFPAVTSSPTTGPFLERMSWSPEEADDYATEVAAEAVTIRVREVVEEMWPRLRCCRPLPIAPDDHVHMLA